MVFDTSSEHMKKILFLSFTVFFASSCSSPKSTEQGAAETIEQPNAQSENPEIQPPHFLQTTDGKYVQLEDLVGKRVFINFWATWCKPCIKEMPDIQAAAEILEKENYVFFMVSDQEMEKIKLFEINEAYNLTFAKLSGKIQDHKIQSLPTTFIYDSTGKRVRRIGGAVKWDSEDMLNSLREVK